MTESTHLRSADYDVRSIPSHAEAVNLITLVHYSHSAPNTSTMRHGLYRAGLMGELVGVALWLPPIKAAAMTVNADNWQGVLSLSRLALLPGLPTNAASHLLGRSMRLIDRDRWPTLLTYADTRLGHTGAIYKATNWRSLGEVPAGDTWIGADGGQRGRKRGGRSLRVAEMLALGFVRCPPAPKIKFVHERLA